MNKKTSSVVQHLLYCASIAGVICAVTAGASAAFAKGQNEKKVLKEQKGEAANRTIHEISIDLSSQIAIIHPNLPNGFVVSSEATDEEKQKLTEHAYIKRDEKNLPNGCADKGRAAGYPYEPKVFAIDLRTDEGRAALALILNAQAEKRLLTLWGKGVCKPFYQDGEALEAVRVRY